jgi:tetratricopeptide (TPR) repeat protein
MKVISTFACSTLAATLLGAAGLLAASAASAQNAAPATPAPKQTNSAKLAKPLKEAHDDLNAKPPKFPEAIAKLKEADATAGKTPYDQHLINELFAFAYLKTNDYADAAKAWEAEIDDGFTTGTELQQKVRGLSEVHYQLKNYDKAIDFGQRALKGGYGDDHTRTIVGQAYYLKGDWKGTLKFEEEIVSNTIKAGGTPAAEPLQLILSSCVKLEDNACQTKALERLVTYYPKPEYWSNLLIVLLKEASSSDTNTLQVYRLMWDTDVLKNGDDYTEMAQLAMDQGTPGDAQRVLQRALERNLFTDQRTKDKNQRLLDKAKQAAANDQASLDKTLKEAEAATTGGKNAGMGLAYLSYGQYDKAIDQLGKAVAKGGLRNAADTQLLLGIAELKGGHKDDAIKAFKAVKGDPVLERLGTLWAIHARQAQ